MALVAFCADSGRSDDNSTIIEPKWDLTAACALSVIARIDIARVVLNRFFITFSPSVERPYLQPARVGVENVEAFKD
jgi:hypothetical protein